MTTTTTTSNDNDEGENGIELENDALKDKEIPPIEEIVLIDKDNHN